MSLAEARRLIARAIAKAEDIGMRGAVAVIGASGALVSASRMDHGGAGGMARARSKAWIAATQQIPSTAHLQRLGHIAPPMVTGFSACSPEAVFPGARGMPVRHVGWVVAPGARPGRGEAPKAEDEPPEVEIEATDDRSITELLRAVSGNGIVVRSFTYEEPRPMEVFSDSTQSSDDE